MIAVEEHPVQWARPLKWSADVAEAMTAIHPTIDVEKCAHFGAGDLELVAVRNSEGHEIAVMGRVLDDDGEDAAPWKPVPDDLADTMLVALSAWYHAVGGVVS